MKVHSLSKYERLGSIIARLPVAICGASVLLSCTPLRNLDATAAGSGLGAVGGASAGGSPGTLIAGNTGAGIAGTSGSGGDAGSKGGTPAAEPDGGAGPTGGTEPNGGAGTSIGGTAPTGGASTQVLSDLPNELNDSPTPGNLRVSSEAAWEVDGVMEPSFEVDTPTAKYFLVKKLGLIVSMLDVVGQPGHDWISYSDNFRPNRGIPNLGDCCQANSSTMLTTTLDAATATPGHVRLNSVSSAGWALVWDFYRTHVTLTVNRAPHPFSFGYRGAPGGGLDVSDRFVDSTGRSNPALSYGIDVAFTGAAQWAYIADDSQPVSLFLIQHGVDKLLDRYGVETSDTSALLFGVAKEIDAPIRFSFGFVDSSSQNDVATRAQYVIDATPTH